MIRTASNLEATGQSEKTAAALIALLNNEALQNVLQHFSCDEINTANAILSKHQELTFGDIHRALDFFQQRCNDLPIYNEDKYQSFELEITRRLADYRDKSGIFHRKSKGSKVFFIADFFSPDVLMSAINEEHTFIGASIILMASPKTRSRILAELDADTLADILLAASSLNVESVKLTSFIYDLLVFYSDQAPKYKGSDKRLQDVADLLLTLANTCRKQAAKAFKELSQSQFDRVLNEGITFDYLTNLSEQEIGQLIKGLDSEIILNASHNLSNEKRQKFYSSLPRRVIEEINSQEGEAHVSLEKEQKARDNLLVHVRQHLTFATP